MTREEKERQVLAEVPGTHDIDARAVVLHNSRLHVAADGDERGDPGLRAGSEQISHGTERDGEHTSKCIVGLGDEDGHKARRTAYKSRCVHDCDDCLLSDNHPWLVEALEGSDGSHGDVHAP